ncbi:hypothetical protein KFE25_012901 [Diacronema lutheri]|uniref:Amine oxidase domain-containing protein n=2 Tax=Diacronema lutheri TaxID=2081491 RepID=A0A8J5X3V1_DIALT|nr:hypothetical protein KFE25_012901 [Diacronema lutheri]
MSSAGARTRVASVDVAIIGAGAAGLAAARELRQAGYSRVLLLEATERVGGRVRDGTIDACGFRLPVELGPEFVHGAEANPLLEALVEMGCMMRTLEWPNYYYFGKEGALLDGETAGVLPEMAAMHRTFDALEGLVPERTREQSLLQHFVEAGLPSRVLDMADAIYANDYGAELSSIGLRETIAEQRGWAHGEAYLVADGRMLSEAMAHLAHGVPLITGFEASLVEWDARADDRAARVRVVDTTGREVACRRLVVTVPLACLQRGALAFVPPLPATKARAIERVRVGNALKVAVALARPIWPARFWDAVCADCAFPEIWLTPPGDAADAHGRQEGKPYVLVAFVSGERSERLAALADAELVRLLLAQLDAMFGSADEPKPASSQCVGQLVCSWRDQPYAWGAYSHPTLGALGARRTIGEPLGGLGGIVHFAGEAVNLAVNPCVHGAMSTGIDAAHAVRASLALEDAAGVGHAARHAVARSRAALGCALLAAALLVARALRKVA